MPDGDVHQAPQHVVVVLLHREVLVDQPVHERHVEILAHALPIEACRPRDVRACLTRTACGLLASDIRMLRDFRLITARNGRWIAEFDRGGESVARASSFVGPRNPFAGGERRFEHHLSRIEEAIGSLRDRAWWLQCLRRLGTGPFERALGQHREACATRGVRNRGALLTKILKDIAAEAGVNL